MTFNYDIHVSWLLPILIIDYYLVCVEFVLGCYMLNIICFYFREQGGIVYKLLQNSLEILCTKYCFLIF